MIAIEHGCFVPIADINHHLFSAVVIALIRTGPVWRIAEPDAGDNRRKLAGGAKPTLGGGRPKK